MVGKWIWHSLDFNEDEYCDFKENFESSGKDTFIKISSDTNYAIYLNGEFVNSGQYATYPNYPVYDEIKLNTKKGSNEIKIIVYYLGSKNFSTYAFDKPGLIFDIIEDGRVIKYSSEETLSRKSICFKNNTCSIITPQLSYRFFYDANYESDENGYHKSVLIEKSYNFMMRENKKVDIKKETKSKIIKNENNTILVDLLKEQTGFIKLVFKSKTRQKLIVSFGEHIIDGGVRRKIGSRDFSFEYTCKIGDNNFFNPLRRLGLRYIEIQTEDEIEIEYIGLIPTVYPFIIEPYNIDNELRQKIYDVCVYTLICCYHEHYEDCPWREQSFYAFDSRNQILTGYYAFKNREQVKSALNLILKDERKDNLLDLCFPDNMDLTIPSFSLHFFKAIEEYYLYTNDIDLINRAYTKLKTILNVFLNNIDNGVLQNFTEDYQWNFYDWVPHMDYPKVKSDICLNSLLIIALNSMNHLSNILNKGDDYSKYIDDIKEACHREFYSIEKRAFIFSKDDDVLTMLGNSLAVLTGIANESESKEIMNRIINKSDDFIKSSLSLKCFLYDALLKVDSNYKDWILNDIDQAYSKMLESGATTFYETEIGAADFDGAGSLCHGWSALPIYYYHLFKIGKK